MRLTASLERMRTKEARELLENLAKSDAETWLAKEARAACARIGRR
jgi:hypothetical protein